MDAHELLSLTLPDQGYLAIHVKMASGRRFHRVYETVDELVAGLRQYNINGNTVYHAIGGFIDGEVKLGFRAKENVGWLRCLPLDIDTKLTHPRTAIYVDKIEAYFALESFCIRARLPPPVLVDSGGGLQPRWPLDQDVDRETWERYAQALKRACDHYGLDADPARTADCSSVLRPPGTTHWGLGVTVECGAVAGPYSLAQFAHLLEEFPDESPGRNRRDRTQQSGKLLSSIGGALKDIARDDGSDPGQCQECCQQIRNYALSLGQYQEPFHFAMAGHAVECGAAGERWYLELGGTDWRDQRITKLDEWKKRRDQKGVSASTCGWIERLKPGGCNGCPVKGTITAPIQLGRTTRATPYRQEPVAESSVWRSSGQPQTAFQSQENHQPASAAPQPTIWQQQTPSVEQPYVNGHSHPFARLSQIVLPPGFIFDTRGRLLFQEERGQGEAKDTIVSTHPIILSGVYRSEAGDSGGRVLAFEQYHPHHGWNSITVPAGQLSTAAGLGLLTDGGANIRDPALFRSLVVQWIDQHNYESFQQHCYEQFGWKRDHTGKRVAFLLGADMRHVGGRAEQVIVTAELQYRAAGIGPVEGGDFREWRRICSTLIPEYDYAGQMALLLSLAAVLMSWMVSDESGGVVNLREISSGTGKTTRLKCAASIWAQWYALRIKNYDTQASQGFLRSRICHLPIFHDEIDKQIKNGETAELYKLITGLSEGEDKTRMDQGGKRTLLQTTTYNTLEMCATNVSLIDALEAHGGSDAAIQRVLEMRSVSSKALDPAYAEALTEELKAHCGTAGDIFLNHLLQPEVMEFTEKCLRKNQSWLYKNTKFKQRDRFKVRQIAGAMTVGELTDQIGGFFWFEWRKAVDWLLAQLQVDEASPEKPDRGPDGANGEEAMRLYLTLHSNDVLRVAGPYIAGAKPYILGPNDQPRGKLFLRAERVSRRIYTPYKEFQKFCIQEGFSTVDCVKALEEIGYVLRHDRQVNLAAGTEFSAVRTRCLEIDADHELSTTLPSIIR